MNWGTKLVIGMLCFMSFIIVLAVLMFNSKPDALVDTDYYEKGLNYDADYNRKEQVKKDHAEPEVNVVEKGLFITFKTPASGIVKLMRIADMRMDKSVRIHADAKKKVQIPLDDVAKGRWKLIISWENEGKSYLDEQEVMIQ